jgi:arylsulfatase A-like enzyme
MSTVVTLQPATRTNPTLPDQTTLACMVLLSLWLGVFGGLIEGLGLLLFQRLNWARWGPMIHVSAPIIWVSPIVDTALFLSVSLLVWLLSRIARRIPQAKVVLALLAFLVVYDWLSVTGRLYRAASVIFAIGAAVASARWFSAHKQATLRFARKTLPVLLVLYLGALAGIEGIPRWKERSATAQLPQPSVGSPNVLLVVIDTLRADHVSSYGYSRSTTPNLDHLAKAGVRFENAIAPSSWSLPSHVSLVTGRYLHDHKVGNVQPEPWFGWGKSGLGGLFTIGEALEQRGYRTGAFSANRTYFSHDLGFGRAFLHFDDYFNSAADGFVRTLYGREFSRIYLIRSNKSLGKRILRRLGFTSLLDQDAEGSGSYGGAFGIRKHADEVNQELLAWIDKPSDHPFFAMANYFDVHDPYGGPYSYAKPAWPQETDLDRYDGGVKYVDDCLGQLLHALEVRGLTKNTVVIVTSDHGESLGQHYLMTHGRALYWELIHVPLVIWYPPGVPAGQVINEPVSNAAIPATIMQLLGAPQAGFIGGLKDSWNRSSTAPLPDPIAELAESKYAGKRDKKADELIPTAATGSMQTVVSPKWQLIIHERLGSQIYDWTTDPGEMKNLIDTPEGRAATEPLKSQIPALP